MELTSQERLEIIEPMIKALRRQEYPNLINHVAQERMRDALREDDEDYKTGKKPHSSNYNTRQEQIAQIELELSNLTVALETYESERTQLLVLIAAEKTMKKADSADQANGNKFMMDVPGSGNGA